MPSKEYYHANKERIRLRNKIYREENKEKIDAYNRMYELEMRDKNNPRDRSEYYALRDRARKLGLTVKTLPENIREEVLRNRSQRKLRTVEAKETKLYTEEMTMNPAEITCQIVTITPDVAKNFLASNKLNRSVSMKRVRENAAAMSRGEFMLNGETIKFDTEGNMIDGQHRLLAIIRSGVSVKSLVVRGLPCEAFATIDSGKARSLSDVLTVSGERNATSLAAAVRLIFELTSNNGAQPSFNIKPTPAQQAGVLETYPELRAIVNKSARFKRILAPGVAAGLHVLFARQNEELAEEFFNRLCDGAQLSKNHPIKTLRDRLMVNAFSAAKLTKIHRVAFTIKAWNAFKAGEEMKITRFKDGEDFPTI